MYQLIVVVVPVIVGLIGCKVDPEEARNGKFLFVIVVVPVIVDPTGCAVNWINVGSIK